MAYDEKLADRIRAQLADLQAWVRRGLDSALSLPPK